MISEKKLVIAGDDPFAEEYINECKEKAKNNSGIIFTGAVYGNDKEALLENCYAFCIPSELEGLPITLLEAMSYSKPCIASSIPANQEALNSNGIYFKTNNTQDLSEVLKTAINNEKYLGEIGTANYNRVKNCFTWVNIAEKYESFCLDIIK
jgi:glycosyltransferase involved in cell wall biosynthesis